MKATIGKRGEGAAPQIKSIVGEPLGSDAFRFVIETKEPCIVATVAGATVGLRNVGRAAEELFSVFGQAFGTFSKGAPEAYTEVTFELPVIEGPESPAWSLTIGQDRFGVQLVFTNEARTYERQVTGHMQSRQTEPARADQVRNSAGGFVFQLDNWKRLERWLILGGEGGTYYASERQVTRENAQTVIACLAEDAARTVRTIVEVSQAGRAPKNDPALFALALAAADPSAETRKLALAALPQVARIGTHLFHFVAYVTKLRRWSAGLRGAISRWYTDQPLDRVALQAVKYQQRDGWSHRDVLRLAHPHTDEVSRDALFRWIVGGAEALDAERIMNRSHVKPTSMFDLTDDDERRYGFFGDGLESLPRIVQGFELIKRAKDLRVVVKLITDYRLPHECVPNEWKSHPEVWAALLPHMGLTAMMRNLAKMTNVGLIKPLSDAGRHVVESLTSVDRLKAERLHPLSILVALRTYAQGHGEKGKLTWTPVQPVVDALDEGFYLSFDAVEPTGKNHYFAVDCSGSMSAPIAGMPVSCRDAAAALAMVGLRTEKFSYCAGFGTGMIEVPISKKMRLDEVARIMSRLPWSGTDCAQPMLDAQKRRMAVDVFTVITDSETYAGHVHPYQALLDYRRTSGRKAKMIVVGMTSTGFTIADPRDGGMLDVVGFDTAAPALMADFARE